MGGMFVEQLLSLFLVPQLMSATKEMTFAVGANQFLDA